MHREGEEEQSTFYANSLKFYELTLYTTGWLYFPIFQVLSYLINNALVVVAFYEIASSFKLEGYVLRFLEVRNKPRFKTQG